MQPLNRIRTENANTPEAWDKIYGNPELAQRWTIWNDAALTKTVGNMIPGNASVLDVGMGGGCAAEAIGDVRLDIEWSGCDASPKAVEFVRNRAALPWKDLFQADVDAGMGIAEKSYDVVLCSEVLEHLEGPADAIAEFVRIARHRVIITTPKENATDTHFHVWSFTAKELLAMLSRHGRSTVEPARADAILVGCCYL